jgi:hypothetical protein
MNLNNKHFMVMLLVKILKKAVYSTETGDFAIKRIGENGRDGENPDLAAVPGGIHD